IRQKAASSLTLQQCLSIALRNIQLFNMQLTAVSGRGIKNIATCQASNVIAAARSDHQGTGKPVE
ncbi:hypothetical protein, partial [Escherichia coli]|uniref:hypothetical protein n=1 Tax=Escherichia coli TaxID=562 RepID=UPI001BACA462